jgi:hypothetical protein
MFLYLRDILAQQGPRLSVSVQGFLSDIFSTNVSLPGQRILVFPQSPPSRKNFFLVIFLLPILTVSFYNSPRRSFNKFYSKLHGTARSTDVLLLLVLRQRRTAHTPPCTWQEWSPTPWLFSICVHVCCCEMG